MYKDELPLRLKETKHGEQGIIMNRGFFLKKKKTICIVSVRVFTNEQHLHKYYGNSLRADAN